MNGWNESGTPRHGASFAVFEYIPADDDDLFVITEEECTTGISTSWCFGNGIPE